MFLLLFSGLTPGVFAIDFSSALKQSAQDTTTAASLFAGKTQVGNLYNQALKIVKQNETASTDSAINGVVAYYTKQSCNVTAQDVLHILYVSDESFSLFFDQQVLSSLSSPWSLPTPASINASYFKFFACAHIKTPSATDFVTVQNNLMSLYYQSVNGVFYSSTLAQENIGEDLFRNGNANDSNFDLLTDINDLGNMMFITFKKAPEVVFYRLPWFSSAWGTNWGTNNSTPWWGSLWGTNGAIHTWTNPKTPTSDAWVRGIGTPPSPVPLWTKSSAQATLTSPSTVSSDADVQQFLTTTNPSTFVQPNTSFLVGNACADTAKLPPSQAAVQETTQDPATDISWVIDFINNANSDETVQDALLSAFNTDYAKEQVTNPTQAGEALANTYAESLFGAGTIGDGSCESSCLSLTGTDQIKCQLGCAKSCIQNCNGLPITDKLLCVTDCSCKMISGPKWDERNKVEDMFSIKFCKEPVKAWSAPVKQNLNNLEGILTAFANVLQWLKSSGQTIKMKKTKEFLDLGITLDMSTLLDFKIFFAFKPIFPQKADAAQKRKAVLDNQSLSKATKWVSPTPSSENYNKYIVIADVAKNSALLQSVADTNSEKTFQVMQQAIAASLPNPIPLYQQQKNAFLAEDIIAFLQSNMAFRDQFLTVSMDMLQDASNLKKKIENSN